MIDFFYVYRINVTDLKKDDKNSNGRITKTEVADISLSDIY